MGEMNLDFFQLQPSKFIDRQCFECCMEKRNGMQPAERRSDTVPVDKKASEQQATEDAVSVNPIATEGYDALEQHD